MEDAHLCTGWGPGNRDTELHRMGAAGEQAEVEGHEGMACDAEVGGGRAWWADQQATPAGR